MEAIYLFLIVVFSISLFLVLKSAMGLIFLYKENLTINRQIIRYLAQFCIDNELKRRIADEDFRGAAELDIILRKIKKFNEK